MLQTKIKSVIYSSGNIDLPFINKKITDIKSDHLSGLDKKVLLGTFKLKNKRK
jgi:hypothetical protein